MLSFQVAAYAEEYSSIPVFISCLTVLQIAVYIYHIVHFSTHKGRIHLQCIFDPIVKDAGITSMSFKKVEIFVKMEIFYSKLCILQYRQYVLRNHAGRILHNVIATC